MLGNPGIAVQVAVSQEVLSSVELVNICYTAFKIIVFLDVTKMTREYKNREALNINSYHQEQK
jgi:hypothetical protein